MTTAEQPRIGGTLRVGLDWEVDRIDPPASFGGWNTGRVVQQVFESLVEDDLSTEDLPCTRLIPALATDYELSDDRLTYTFRLRRGVFFHDGMPFDAEAAKFNIDRMWNTEVPQYSPTAALYNQVVARTLCAVRAIDRHTLQISLQEPFAELLRYMTQEDAPGAFVFISPHAIDKYGSDDTHDLAAGTGPFKFLTRFRTAAGSGVMLERNPGYWGGAPYLDRIVFTPLPEQGQRAAALERGELDLVYSPDPQYLPKLREAGFIVRNGPVPYVWYFSFNLKQQPLDDVRVRRAIAHAVDRKRLSERLFGEGTIAAPSLLPPASPSFQADFPDPYPCDLDKARALLAEAGHPTGFRFRLIVARAGSAQLDPVAIANHLSQDLARVGISVEIDIREDWLAYCTEWQRGMPAGVGASEMSWGMSCDVWLEQVLHSRYSSPTGFNTGHYARAEVDRLLDLARTAPAEAERIRLYREAHRLIMEDLPILPILTIRSGLVVHSPRVKDFKFPAQNWHDFRPVWLSADQRRTGPT